MWDRDHDWVNISDSIPSLDNGTWALASIDSGESGSCVVSFKRFYFYFEDKGSLWTMTAFILKIKNTL